MMRTILMPAALAALLGLLTASQAHAYGAVSRTATYTNPYTGRTATAHETTAVGPNGNAYHEENVEGTGYRGGYEAGGARVYSPSTYDGYSGVGTTHTGYYGNGSVVRSTTNP